MIENLWNSLQITTSGLHCEKWENMTIGVSIVNLVIKVLKLVLMIDIEYKAYQVSIVNTRWPPKIEDSRHENEFFWHFHIRRQWFPAHHRDRLVFLYNRSSNSQINLRRIINWTLLALFNKTQPYTILYIFCA